MQKRREISYKEHPYDYNLFHNQHGLMDGNVYGVVFNKLGVATHGFPTLAGVEDQDNLSTNICIDDVHVSNIKGCHIEVLALRSIAAQYNGGNGPKYPGDPNYPGYQGDSGSGEYHGDAGYQGDNGDYPGDSGYQGDDGSYPGDSGYQDGNGDYTGAYGGMGNDGGQYNPGNYFSYNIPPQLDVRGSSFQLFNRAPSARGDGEFMTIDDDNYANARYKGNVVANAQAIIAKAVY